MIKYTIAAKNLFAVLATLLTLRVPFEFQPHKVYNDKKRPNEYHKSVVVVYIEENGKTTLSHVLWSLDNHWGDTYDLEILKEERC